MSDILIDHIAVVVESLEAAGSRLAGLPVSPGPIDTFPKDGTREVYMGPAAATSRLLLIEPLHADTPYGRALARCGPGLHHIGVTVPDLVAFVVGTHGTGWYVHPRSLLTMRDTGTVWLARPGIAWLLEVREATLPPASLLITRIELPLAPEHERLLRPLCPTGVPPGSAMVHRSPDERVWLTLDGQRIAVDAITA